MTLQPLTDIAERVELLKTTLGLFAPGEPTPIADELRGLGADILRHWWMARGRRPEPGLPFSSLLEPILADQGLASAAQLCTDITRLHDTVAAAPDDAATQSHLVALVDAVGELYALVAPRLAANDSAVKPGGVKRMLAALALIGGLLIAAPALAEDVSTRYHGLTLLGNLEFADGKGPEDGVALLVHGTLAHDRMETIAELQKNLRERGVSSLAITLSLGHDRRTGMFDCGALHAHRPYDALDEIDAWIGWLKNNGATDITIIGHSQGGNQVAVYGIERRDASVSGLVLLAPATFDVTRVAEAYKARYEAELPPILDKARAMVQAGQGVERIEGVGFLTCANATVTAESFTAWYTPSPLRDTPKVLPREPVRTLVVVAGNDEIVPDLGPAVTALARPSAKGRGEIRIRTIEGADHFFHDIYNDDAADVIAEWIKG